MTRISSGEQHSGFPGVAAPLRSLSTSVKAPASMQLAVQSSNSETADAEEGYNPPTDLLQVLGNQIKEWHFHIYFLQNNAKSKSDALKLRDAILSLRKDGAFVAVPLFRVNYGPLGPHTVGSYEVWCPIESFAEVFSYVTLYRGSLSILIHPLTREERKDHDTRKAWLGQPYGLDLSVLPVLSETVPAQYPSLKLGYNSEAPKSSIEERKKAGKKLEELLKKEPEAAIIGIEE